MADDVTVDTITGSPVVATDDDGSRHWPYVKLAFGADNTQTLVGSISSNPLPVALSSTDNAVLDAIAADTTTLAAVDYATQTTLAAINTKLTSGTVIGDVNLGATDNAVLDSIAALLATIDADTSNLSVVGGGTEAAAIRVTLASDSTGVLSVDDGGSTLSIDDGGGSITIDNAGLTELAAAINGSSQLDVNIAANALNSSTFIDDGDWTALTSYHTLMGGIYQSTPGTITDGDTGPWRMTANGEGHVSLTTALPAGTNAIGKLSANSGVDIGDVDVTSIAAGTNAIGDVGITTRTSGGTSTYYNDGAVTLASIKASAGQIYSIEATNNSSTLYYLQLFNLGTGSVTLGTTTPTNEYVIPHNSGNGAGFMRVGPLGRAYGTAISYAITTTKGGATTGTADDVLLNVDYA